MVRKNRPQSSSLFLMELILAILFFSIASAVCVQFFVKSHLLSQRSQELSHAVNECSTIAEICKTSDSISQAVNLLSQEYPSADIPSLTATTDHTEFVFYFDKDFNICEKNSEACKLKLTLQEKDQMLITQMQVIRAADSSVIYELETNHHIARKVSHE